MLEEFGSITTFYREGGSLTLKLLVKMSDESRLDVISKNTLEVMHKLT